MSEEKRVASMFDYVRMCNSCSCTNCPLGNLARMNSESDCHFTMRAYPKESNEAILKWCDEHPQKTYLQDFFEKFPNAKRSQIDPNLPMFCRYSLYGCVSNEYNFCREMYCASCWNEVMSEEETK